MQLLSQHPFAKRVHTNALAPALQLAEKPSEQDKYDRSSHSHRPERGDLNSPGQVDEKGNIGPAHLKEKPSEAPKHRG